MKKTKIAKWIILGIGALIVLSVLASVMRWCGQVKEVIMEEVAPRELLRKYMWFKEASAMLDKHLADANSLIVKVRSLEAMYEGEKRKDWSRTDQEQHSLWLSEVDGVKTAYTNLAAEYNAKMAEINWAFCNKGTLPKGADNVLPREYKPYSEVSK